MKNSLTDVNNYLFEAIERLNDDSLTDEQLDKEIRRADSVTKVARAITENNRVALDIKKHLDEYGVGENYIIPGMIESK